MVQALLQTVGQLVVSLRANMLVGRLAQAEGSCTYGAIPCKSKKLKVRVVLSHFLLLHN